MYTMHLWPNTKDVSTMRRDTTPDNGGSLELRIWLITLCVLIVSAWLQSATTSHRSGKAAASGAVHFKPSVLIAMPLRVVRSDTKGGKGVRKYKEKMCISLPPSFVRFRQFKPKGSQFKPNQTKKQNARF
jgi:hypothetical protein